MGAVSVVMALIARERSGRGQRIEIPLAEAFAEAYSTMLGMRVYENPLMGDSHLLRDLTYQCADGGIIDLSPYSKFVIPLLAAAGVAEEWERLGLIDVAARDFSLERRDQAMAMFADLVRSRPASWWDEVAARARMPVPMVRTPAEWVATEQAVRSGTVLTLDDPLAGPTMMPGRGFDLSRPPAPPPARPGPRRAARRAARRARPRRPPGPAGGFGGFGCRGCCGAAVDLPLSGFTALDVSSAPGSRLTAELIRRSDALVTNFTPMSQARYGIDYERVGALNPDLVHCSITAYGLSGPWAHRRGYENQCNAATGMSWRYGYRFGWTLYQPTPINDAGTGILGAYAVAVALFARLKGGGGQQVGASLAQASTFHQAPYLVAEARGSTAARGSADGPDALRNEYGSSALNRFYQARDGWFFLAARPGELAALLRVAGLDDRTSPGDWDGAADRHGAGDRDGTDDRAGRAGQDRAESWPDPGGLLARDLEARFAQRQAASWIERLASAGIAAHVVVSIDQAVDYLHRRGVVYFERGLGGTDVPKPGIGRWLSETPPVVGTNPGPIGSQAVEILAGLGLTEPEMKELAEANVLCLAGRAAGAAQTHLTEGGVCFV
ncbi:CoA transferase [Parafrankia sp. EAN1pec]|uniref:CoA transferase n=1 Tax=Parafrankia sp. (strain EAN1pec) TaxID=298653 RepID=UPI0026D80E22